MGRLASKLLDAVASLNDLRYRVEEIELDRIDKEIAEETAQPYTQEEIGDLRREWLVNPDPHCPPPGEMGRWLATVGVVDAL